MKNEQTIQTKNNSYKKIQCPGCGSETIIKEGQKICQRCFRIVHYNDFKAITKPLNKSKIIENVNTIAQGAIIVIDLFNFNIEDLDTLIGAINNDIIKILVINKIDLADKNIRINRVIEKISLQLNHIKNLNIIAISGLQDNNKRKQLFNLITNFKNDSNIVFVGYENAGKTTLISKLLTSQNVNHHLVNSRFPGTTESFINFKINEINIIDTPGLVNEFSIRKYSTDSSSKKWTFKSSFRPKIYQLNPDQTIMFGNLISFDFTDGPVTNFTIYHNPNINIQRTKTTNLERLFQKNPDFFKWPIIKNQNFKTEIIKLENNNAKIELEIIDIGIIKLISEGQTLVFRGPINKMVKIRKSLF